MGSSFILHVHMLDDNSVALARPFLNPAEKFACVYLVVVSWCYLLVLVEKLSGFLATRQLWLFC
jgi:hypothetical protein